MSVPDHPSPSESIPEAREVSEPLTMHELTLLAECMVTARTPMEAERLKEDLVQGFFGKE